MSRGKFNMGGQPGKINKALVIDNVAKHMISSRVYPVAISSFPERFLANEPEDGKTLIYRVLDENERTVRRVPPQYVVGCIIKYCSENWPAYPELLIDPETATKIFKNWLGRVEKIPGLIKSFEFQGDGNYVTHRVPFKPDLMQNFDHVDLKSKHWKAKYPYLEFLSRCSSPEQLAAFIGSIFCEESYNQQYVNIWGGGNDGKGSLIRALSKILAGAFHSDNFECVNQFWTSSFIGKRLVAFTDNNNQAFMQTGLWKQLTGGDSIRIELKREVTFNSALNAKFIITSNFAPVLKLDRADQRRAIIVHVDEIEGQVDPEVEKRMAEWEQLKFLVEYSFWAYRKNCVKDGKHIPIPIDEDKQVEFMQNADEDIEQKILSKFRFGNSYVMPFDAIVQLLNDKIPTNKLSRILTQRFGCIKFRARAGSGVRMCYYAGIGDGFSQDAGSLNDKYRSKVEATDGYVEALNRIKIDQDLAT